MENQMAEDMENDKDATISIVFIMVTITVIVTSSMGFYGVIWGYMKAYISFRV